MTLCSTKYQSERRFSTHNHHNQFDQIFKSLVKSRLCQIEWAERAPPENIVRVLLCLRLLLRDQAYQKKLFELDGVKVLSEKLQVVTESYLRNGQQPFLADILKEMTNIFQKLASDGKQREWLIACGAHKVIYFQFCFSQRRSSNHLFPFIFLLLKRLFLFLKKYRIMQVITGNYKKWRLHTRSQSL